MITLENWQVRLAEDMKLHGFSDKTQSAYMGAVRRFVQWIDREPATWTEEDLRKYVLFMQQTKKLSPSTRNVAVQALKFFLIRSLGKTWQSIGTLKVKRRQRIPVVLSVGEVRRVLGVVRHPLCHMILTTIYGLGVRLNEGLRLETSHIDAAQQMVWVRNGKGAKDRGVILPRPLLDRLRTFWQTERPKSDSPHLFVSPQTGRPPHPSLIQRTFKAACKDARTHKPATVHTLRHSYATHLIERGVSVRAIQSLLGHKSLTTTMAYTHITHTGTANLQATVDDLMADL